MAEDGKQVSEYVCVSGLTVGRGYFIWLGPVMRLVYPITITSPFVVSPPKGPSTGPVSFSLVVFGTLAGTTLIASLSRPWNSTLAERSANWEPRMDPLLCLFQRDSTPEQVSLIEVLVTL